MPKPSSMPLRKFDRRGSLQHITWVSLAVVILMIALSLAGLLLPERLYPSEVLRAASRPNDLVNLIVGVPIILGAIALARRDLWLGWLAWPGALLYTAYNYAAYAFSRTPDYATLAFAVVVLLCAYGINYLLRHINVKAVRQLLAEGAPVRFAGWVLIVYGVVFLLKAISVIYTAFNANGTVSAADLGVPIADALFATLLIAGGVSQLRHHWFGTVSGLGLLFATVALFVGVILVVMVQPAFVAMAFPMDDVLVLLGMGVASFIVFGWFTRAVQRAKLH